MPVPLSIGLATDLSLDWRALIPALEDAAEFVTLTDQFDSGQDALILANWLAGQTQKLGIVAGVALNFAEPFHVSTAIATLDHVTDGRAGLLVQTATGREEAAIGRAPADLTADLEDAVEAIRQLWDSWQDDAIIRDAAAHRFLDADRLHHVNFRGQDFSISGPSITPRPPQGQPVVIGPVAGADLALASLANLTVDGGITADEIVALHHDGLTGWHLIPRTASDLPHLLRLLPQLRRRGVISPPRGGSLRSRLGLSPAPNRFAA